MRGRLQDSRRGKTGLRVLIIPNTVLHVTGFNDCPNLQAVIINGGTCSSMGRNDYECIFDGVQVIDAGCFANCPNQQYVEMGSPVKSIGAGAFRGTQLRETCMLVITDTSSMTSAVAKLTGLSRSMA